MSTSLNKWVNSRTITKINETLVNFGLMRLEAMEIRAVIKLKLTIAILISSVSLILPLDLLKILLMSKKRYTRIIISTHILT
jgi:hypothetical protein